MSKQIAQLSYKEKATFTPFRNLQEMCELAKREKKPVTCFFFIENVIITAQPTSKAEKLMDEYRAHAKALEEQYKNQDAALSKDFIHAKEPETLQFVALEKDSPVVTKSQIDYVRQVLQQYDVNGR
jgi:hypothetical protein